jgi:hypothetical protein
MIDNYVKKAKEGTILSSTAYDGDGQGDRRTQLYQRAGFSNTKGLMLAIVKGGKLTPITESQIKSLKKAGHIK